MHQNHEPDLREHTDPVDQVREVRIHGNYFSQRDVDFCLACDLSSLKGRAEFSQMDELHQTLRGLYEDPDTLPPAL